MNYQKTLVDKLNYAGIKAYKEKYNQGATLDEFVVIKNFSEEYISSFLFNKTFEVSVYTKDTNFFDTFLTQVIQMILSMPGCGNPTIRPYMSQSKNKPIKSNYKKAEYLIGFDYIG